MGSISDIVNFQMLQPLLGATLKPLTPIKLPSAMDTTPSPNPNDPGQNFKQGFNAANYGPPTPAAPPPATPAQAGQAAGQAANASQQVVSQGEAANAAGLPAPAPAPVQSDATTKTNIEVGNKPVDQFLGSLGVHQYQYKDPQHGQGTHFSVMAQELEKAGPVGKSMVINTPEGKKVDYARGLAVFLAGLTNHHQRIEKMENILSIHKGKK